MTQVVSLLTDVESIELELQRESELCSDASIDFQRVAVEDRGVPSRLSTFWWQAAASAGVVSAGGAVVSHCRQGIGRASLLAAAVLMELGHSADDAWARVETARGRPVPDTVEQRAWLADAYRLARLSSAGVGAPDFVVPKY